ncbi:MAG: RNA pseudouridine synthase [Thermodesulforhabdaceae bacterium]
MDRRKFFFHPSWPIFYEDNHLLALYKPSGLLTQEDSSEELSLYSLAKLWIKETYAKPGNVFLGLVQRLDRAAAGIIVFAKTSKAASRLAKQFRDHVVEKVYLAVVEGLVEKDTDTLIHYVEPGRTKTLITQFPGREAKLTYKVLARSYRLKRTLLEVNLYTGRKHQIRVQLSSIGHPLLGDYLYGSSFKFPKGALALLAYRITFLHPTQKIPITLTSPVPTSWPWEGNLSKSKSLFWLWDEIKDHLDLPAGM